MTTRARTGMETDTAGLNPARQGSNCFCRLTGRVLSCCPASWPRSAAASWSYCHFGYIPVGRMEYRLEKQWSKVAQKQASRQAARPRILLLRIQCLVLTAWVTRKRASTPAWVAVLSFLAGRPGPAFLFTVPDGWQLLQSSQDHTGRSRKITPL